MNSAGRVRWMAFSALLLTAVVAGCEREDPPAVDRNLPPQTFITQGPKLSSDPRDPVNLFYRAHLFWRGEDRDGTVQGFRFAIDDTSDAAAWRWTVRTDSVFRFLVGEIATQEHLFLIRAVDNLGKQDPTPDTLRFESFTAASPVVALVEIAADMPTLGRVEGLGRGDTVEVFSNVTFVWTGSDADGEVIGWETKFDTELNWRFHERTDTTRAETNLSPGAHTLTVRAVDDAGARSRDPGRFKIFSNYDPKTVLDRTSIVAKLPRPWISASDTLTAFPRADADTVPLNSTISMCWNSTDIDGPVDRYQYFFTSRVIGQTRDTCASPTSVLDQSSFLGSPGGVFLVRGIDIYDNVEGKPDTLRLFVNFRPTVQWTDNIGGADTLQAFAGEFYRYTYNGTDKDSNAADLRFNVNIDNQSQSVVFTQVPPGQRFVDYFFESPRDLGVRRFVVIAKDQSEDVPSAPDRLFVRVSDPSGRASP